MEKIQQCTPGELVIAMVTALEAEGLLSVYLRNYEGLPHEVGNDVDLLVPSGERKRAIAIITDVARQQGWVFLSRADFSPLAVYFANLETGETLHLDLFDRLEWHFLEFAEASAVLSRRCFNGMVHIPAAEDELYLNLSTRLLYQGKIREKHRDAVRHFLATHGPDRLKLAFQSHLGERGNPIFECLARQDWQPQSDDRKALLGAITWKYGLRSPIRLLAGGCRYVTRSVRKILRPPGRLIVLEGADGVGKSTVLKEIIPWCSEWSGGRDAYDFHWKPLCLHSGPRHQAPAVDPRAKNPRSSLASLAYLVFHLTGFWWGWFLRIRPLLCRSHPVIGDRYSYDLFLDPARFRLSLHPSICRMAALLAPRPAVTVGLVANPETVHARKPELSLLEISSYQERWGALSAGRSQMVTVPADGSPEEVIFKVKKAILRTVCLFPDQGS